MRIGLIGLSLMGALLAGPASADDDPMLPYHVGDLLESESLCGLSFDDVATTAYVASKTPAGDPGFVATMNLARRQMRDSFRRLNAMQQLAHCGQVSRLARKYGLMR